MHAEPPIAPVDDSQPARGPWHRNPWLWGVVAGLIFVPAIRPFMRHIPDAPPLLAALPDYELHASGGDALRGSDFAGRVYVMGLYGAACEPGCGEVLAALRGLSGRFVQFDRSITVLAVELAEQPAAPLAVAADLHDEWLSLHAAPGSLDALATHAVAPHMDSLGTSRDAVSVAREARLLLIDAVGNLRGHYGIDELGLDEAYHRAQHVLRDHKKEGLLPR